MTSGPTILVVEDNPTTRKMLRVALQIEGYRVLEAPDGRAALVAFAADRPDLVLQDLILPDMDGLELVRQLRASPGGVDVPILALSGFVGRLEDGRTAQAGFTGILVKPIEPGRLMDALGAYLPRPTLSHDQRGQGRTIVLVDDDPVQLKLARLNLTRAGFEVTTADSGEAALATARAHPPHLILSDVLMPGMDGFQLCLEARRDPRLTSVPIVLLSSQYHSEADRHLAHEVGASALVLRTPELELGLAAALQALAAGPVPTSKVPSAEVQLAHAQSLNQQLDRQLAVSAGLAQRCTFQAGQLSLLGGVAEALAKNSDPDAALADVLAATLDAAGISKGALFLGGSDVPFVLRHAIGFSDAERAQLADFFGQAPLLAQAIERRAAISIPSSLVPEPVARAVLVEPTPYRSRWSLWFPTGAASGRWSWAPNAAT